MRIVFKNSKLVFAAAKWSAKGKIIKVDSNEVSKVSLPTNAKVYSRNLVDVAQLRYKKILNDSGVEVADSSSYFANFIPAVGGMKLLSNQQILRLYLYDENKTLLKRSAPGRDIVEVPSDYNGKSVMWVQIQTSGGFSEEVLSKMIVVRDEDSAPATFESYQSNTDGTIYSPYSWVWADDLSEIEITAK